MFHDTKIKSANDNILKDAIESVTEVLYTGAKLLAFTKKAVELSLLTSDQKDFIDEICGKFSEFDEGEKQRYSALDMRRNLSEILKKCEINKGLLKEAFLSQDENIGKFTEDSIYEAFKTITQADIAAYALGSGVPDQSIDKITGDTSGLAGTIISERK